MQNFVFQKPDPSHNDFQYLEDMSTAYWYSEIIFAAIELDLFTIIGRSGMQTADIAEAANCDKGSIMRLLKVLQKISLIGENENIWYNLPMAAKYLVKSGDYIGDYLLYRKYIQRNWQDLVKKISSSDQPMYSFDDDYKKRNLSYVASNDKLIRIKSGDIIGILKRYNWTGPVLDAGGGAGSLARAVLDERRNSSKIDKDSVTALLFDLPEVIEAAKELYSDTDHWLGIDIAEGDFRNHDFGKGKFGLILLSNFLHAYGAESAKEVLKNAAGLLDKDGIILIHDYFPDRSCRSPHKGSLYDINMMLNTYNGACHESSLLKEWLKEYGIGNIIKDLSTDTSVIIGSRNEQALQKNSENNLEDIIYAASEMGLTGYEIKTGIIAVEPWVELKCRFGCRFYGKKLHCPPNSIDYTKTKRIIESYKSAILIEGGPPGMDFYNKLLELEKHAFLAGFYKAFAFGAGPCPFCPECPEDRTCRHPEKARPSMEGAGIDVYATARNAGAIIDPVKKQGDYVKYFGLLLLD